jgi:hypothetical protein
MIFNTIRVFADNLSRLRPLTHVQFFSSKLANLFIVKVGSYLCPSATIINLHNSCDAIAKR